MKRARRPRAQRRKRSSTSSPQLPGARTYPLSPLTVRGINKGHAKTPLRGWYLKVDHSVGVDQEGNFYVLKSFLSLPERLKGVTPEPSAPPLTLGYGGRDGESIDLVDALTKILPTWREPPAP